jgi:hypothetical protein
MGFSLHAATRAGAKDARGREALCKYVLRPPMSQERLHLLPDGMVRIKLRKPYRDGTYAVDMDPALAALSSCDQLSLRDLGPTRPTPAPRGFAAPVASPTSAYGSLRWHAGPCIQAPTQGRATAGHGARRTGSPNYVQAAHAQVNLSPVV